MKQAYSNVIWTFFLLFLAGWVYLPSLQNGWVGLDDDELILNNPTVQALTVENLKIYFTNHSMGHYLPVTRLAYAVEYFFFQENAFGYHLVSLVLHLLFCTLLYFFCRRLFPDNNTALWVSGISLLHPLSVESVSWVSAQSNLWCSVFYLAGLLAYQRPDFKYQRAITMFLFIIASLSKSAAVTFPLALVWIDFQKGLSIQKSVSRHLSYFLGAFIFGAMAVFFANQFGTLNTQELISVWEKPLLTSYALIFYLQKYLLPWGLSALHFLPIKLNYLPWYYYASFVFVLIGLVYLFWLARKNRFAFLGLLWFLLHVFLVLQWITIGKVFAAERYSYLAYPGLSIFFLNVIPAKYWRIIIPFFWVILSGISYQRVQVWKDSKSLYQDVIEKYPEHGYGYYGLGLYHLENHDFNSAIIQFTEALKKEIYFPNALLNRGNAYIQKGDLNSAQLDYKQALYQKKDYLEARVNLGYTYWKQQDYQQTLNCLKELESTSHHQVYFMLADASWNLGMKSQSCAYYQRYQAIGGQKITRINYCD